jgi:hypothetical protein
MGNRRLARLLIEVIARLDQQLAIIKREKDIMAGIKAGPKELQLKALREKRERVARAKAVIDKAIANPKPVKPARRGARRGK